MEMELWCLCACVGRKHLLCSDMPFGFQMYQVVRHLGTASEWAADCQHCELLSVPMSQVHQGNTQQRAVNSFPAGDPWPKLALYIDSQGLQRSKCFAFIMGNPIEAWWLLLIRSKIVWFLVIFLVGVFLNHTIGIGEPFRFGFLKSAVFSERLQIIFILHQQRKWEREGFYLFIIDQPVIYLYL